MSCVQNHQTYFFADTFPPGQDNAHPTIEQVHSIPLFAELDEPELEQISKGLSHIRLERNDYLCRQGNEADCAYFIESGTLNIFNALPGGGEVLLAQRKPGSMLGETCLVSRSLQLYLDQSRNRGHRIRHGSSIFPGLSRTGKFLRSQAPTSFVPSAHNRDVHLRLP